MNDSEFVDYWTAQAIASKLAGDVSFFMPAEARRRAYDIRHGGHDASRIPEGDNANVRFMTKVLQQCLTKIS